MLSTSTAKVSTIHFYGMKKIHRVSYQIRKAKLKTNSHQVQMVIAINCVFFQLVVSSAFSLALYICIYIYINMYVYICIYIYIYIYYIHVY